MPIISTSYLSLEHFIPFISIFVVGQENIWTILPVHLIEFLKKTFRSNQSRQDKCYILLCPFQTIVSYNEYLMESFIQSLFRLNRDDKTLLLLYQVITNDHHPSLPLRLKILQWKLRGFGLRSLCYSIFLRSMSSTILSGKHQASILVSSIIKL